MDMASTGRKRQVLANFIIDVPSHKGWWFCLPKLCTNGKKSAIHPTHVCLLPHLGVPVGISEDCMAATSILTEMEWCLIWINKKDGMTQQSVQGGWELLHDEFKVAVTDLECGQRQSKVVGKNAWYITRLGETGEQLNATNIFQQYKKGQECIGVYIKKAILAPKLEPPSLNKYVTDDGC
jgi:hypothetical protein